MENAQFLDKLLSARSLRGYTPLEELESQLDGERIKSGQDFEGFPEAAIDCLAALRDTRTLDLVERRRLALGCTCSEDPVPIPSILLLRADLRFQKPVWMDTSHIE